MQVPPPARTHKPRVRRFTWFGERELRAKRMRVRDPDGKYWLPFLPDGYFEITYPDGRVQCSLLEVDMGTLTLRRFARKVRAFETALDRDVFHKHVKRDEFEVFVLTQSERRLEALRRAAGPVVHDAQTTDARGWRSCWRSQCRPAVRPARSGALKPADVEDALYAAAARDGLLTGDGER